jgi:hypothetical protein
VRQSGRHLGHLKRKEMEQGDCDRSSRSSGAGLLNEGRNVQDVHNGSEEMQISVGTGEGQREFVSADMLSTCEVVCHREVTPGQ